MIITDDLLNSHKHHAADVEKNSAKKSNASDLQWTSTTASIAYILEAGAIRIKSVEVWQFRIPALQDGPVCNGERSDRFAPEQARGFDQQHDDQNNERDRELVIRSQQLNQPVWHPVFRQ